MPTIVATNPVAEPAVPSINYGHWGLSMLRSTGTGIGAPATMSYQLTLLGFDANNVEIEHPTIKTPECTVPDIFALAAERPAVATALGALLQAIVEDATIRGAI